MYAGEANSTKLFPSEAMATQGGLKSMSEGFSYATGEKIPASVKPDKTDKLNLAAVNEIDKGSLNTVNETDYKKDLPNFRLAKSAVLNTENLDEEIFDSFIDDFATDSEPCKQISATGESLSNFVEIQLEEEEKLEPIEKGFNEKLTDIIIVKSEPIENSETSTDDMETFEESEQEEFINKQTPEVEPENTENEISGSTKAQYKETAETKGHDSFTSIDAQEQLIDMYQENQNTGKDVFNEKGDATSYHTGSFFQGGFHQELPGTLSLPQLTEMQGLCPTVDTMDNPRFTVPQIGMSVPPAYDKNSCKEQNEAEIIKEMFKSTQFHELIYSPGKSRKEKVRNKDKIEKEKESLKRKRERRPETWKKNVRKKLRTEGKAYVSANGKLIEAKHLQPVDCTKCKQKCTEKISEEARKKIFEWFWKLGSYTAQKEFVLSRVKQVTPKTNKLRQVHRLFSLDINGKCVSVCKTFFTRTLGVSGNYIQTAFEQKARDLMVQDGRGKSVPSNKTPEEQIESVRKHLDIYLAKHPIPDPVQKGTNLMKWYNEYIAMCEEEDKKPVSKYMYRQIFNEYMCKYFLDPLKRFTEHGLGNQYKNRVDGKGDSSVDNAHERGNYAHEQPGTCERVSAHDHTFVQGLLNRSGNQNETFQPNTLHEALSQYNSRLYFQSSSILQDGFKQGLPCTESFLQPAFISGNARAETNGNPMVTVPETGVPVFATDTSHDDNIDITRNKTEVDMFNRTPVQELKDSPGKSSKEQLMNKETLMNIETIENESSKTGRRGRPEIWKKNIRKRLRAEGKAYINVKGKLVSGKYLQPVDCSKCKQRCTEKVSETARKVIFEWFWNLGSYTAQKEFVLSRVEQVTPKTNKSRQVHRFFSFDINRKHVYVCKTFFTRTLGISGNYIHTAFEQKARDSIVQDGRGKGVPSNKTPEEQIDGVHKHLDIYLAKYPVHKPLPKSISALKWYDKYMTTCGEKDMKAVSKYMYRKIFKEYTRKYPTSGEIR